MPAKGKQTERLAYIGFGAGLAALLLVAAVSYWGIFKVREDFLWVSHTEEVLRQLSGALGHLTDAETGQRGYLITGQERYLEPYRLAESLFMGGKPCPHVAALRELTRDDPAQQERLGTLERLSRERLASLAETIALRREKGPEAAQARVLTDEGKRIMDDIRQVITEMNKEEERLLHRRQSRQAATMRFVFIVMGAVLLMIPLISVFVIWEIKRDTTRRKQATDRIEDLAKFPSEDPYPVLRIADDGTTLYANAAATALLADSNCAVGGAAPEPWRQLSRRVLATGLPDALEETHGQHTVLFSATPVADKGYVNVYGVDITDRKLAREERKRLIAELERKNAELERFAYTVSHDLKGPLITVKGFAGLLAKQIADGRLEKADEDIGRISRAADRMHQLLDELLDLSRVGRLVGPPEDVPLADLAREAMELMALLVGESGVEIHIPDDLPVVRGDRPRLLSVMQNLMDNAVKFMGDQPEPRVEVGGRHHGDETLCWVRDNGVGIDPKYHDRVFGLFDQLHQGTSEGTGIGLALVKRIVQVHGGRIWIESEGQGQGTTFCFALPRKGESANGKDQ